MDSPPSAPVVEVESPPPAAPPPPAPVPRRRRSERMQLIASLIGAGVTLLASGNALVGGDHRKVVWLAFLAGALIAVVSVVKYRRATRGPAAPAP